MKTLELIANRTEADYDELSQRYDTLQQQYQRLVKAHDQLRSDLIESHAAEQRTEKALENSGLAYHQVLAGLTQSYDFIPIRTFT